MEIRPQTKVMDPMVCTTRDGVKNVFRDIQVISSVKKDKVSYQMVTCTIKLYWICKMCAMRVAVLGLCA